MARVNQVNHRSLTDSYTRGLSQGPTDSIGVCKGRLINLINPAREDWLRRISCPNARKSTCRIIDPIASRVLALGAGWGGADAIRRPLNEIRKWSNQVTNGYRLERSVGLRPSPGIHEAELADLLGITANRVQTLPAMALSNGLPLPVMIDGRQFEPSASIYGEAASRKGLTRADTDALKAKSFACSASCRQTRTKVCGDSS